MKYLQQALVILSVITLVIFGCSKEHSYEIPGGGSSSVYQWAFTESTNSYLGPMDSARIDTQNSIQVLTMTGHSADGKDIITLQIIADSIKVGTYQTPHCTFDYLRNGINLYQSDINATGQFSVSITAIDSISISGNFSGTAPDTAKNAKNITKGTFKVKFKSAASAVPSNCKISKLLYVDSATGSNFYSIFSQFSSNTVSGVSLSDSSGGQLNSANFQLTYSTGKVSIDASGKQYFTLDANGRATSFHGYVDPSDNSNDSNLIIATYTYDAGGHLTKRVQTTQTITPALTIEMDYTYSGDQLTQTAVKSGSFTGYTIAYTYDAGKPVKSFLDFHPFATEIFYFQSAVNTGVVCNQALIKSVLSDYTAGPTPTIYTSYLNNYVIDANQHVQSFAVSGDSFDPPFAFSFLSMFSSTTYKLTYHCQ